MDKTLSIAALLAARWARRDGQCPGARNAERTQWALTREEMKNCVWVKPELVVQIEFGEWTPDGHLRHSKFVGLREDKDPQEVRREAEH